MLSRRSPRLIGVAVTLLAIVASAAEGQSASAEPPHRTLIVGTKEAPPFAIKGGDGAWTGISIELWRDIARELGYRFELREWGWCGCSWR